MVLLTCSQALLQFPVTRPQHLANINIEKKKIKKLLNHISIFHVNNNVYVHGVMPCTYAEGTMGMLKKPSGATYVVLRDLLSARCTAVHSASHKF